MKKRGDMNIFGAIIAFSIILLLIPVLQFFQFNQKVTAIEENIEESLMDATTLYSVINYDSIKYQNNKSFSIDENRCVDAVFAGANFTKHSNTYKNNGLTIHDASVEYGEDTNSIVLTYKMDVPFKIIGKTFTTATISRTATAYFQKIS